MSNQYVRGASVNFTIQFKDADGNTVTPTNATLRIVYKHNKVDVTVSISLTDAGAGNWSAEWASDPADYGTVYWWAQSGNPPKSALQGEFKILANAASLQT